MMAMTKIFFDTAFYKKKPSIKTFYRLLGVKKLRRDLSNFYRTIDGFFDFS